MAGAAAPQMSAGFSLTAKVKGLPRSSAKSKWRVAPCDVGDLIEIDDEARGADRGCESFPVHCNLLSGGRTRGRAGGRLSHIIILDLT